MTRETSRGRGGCLASVVAVEWERRTDLAGARLCAGGRVYQKSGRSVRTAVQDARPKTACWPGSTWFTRLKGRPAKTSWRENTSPVANSLLISHLNLAFAVGATALLWKGSVVFRSTRRVTSLHAGAEGSPVHASWQPVHQRLPSAMRVTTHSHFTFLFQCASN